MTKTTTSPQRRGAATRRGRLDLDHLARAIAQYDLEPIMTLRSVDGRVDLIIDGKTVTSRPIELASELGLYILGFADGRGYGRSEDDDA